MATKLASSAATMTALPQFSGLKALPSSRVSLNLQIYIHIYIYLFSKLKKSASWIKRSTCVTGDEAAKIQARRNRRRPPWSSLRRLHWFAYELGESHALLHVLTKRVINCGLCSVSDDSDEHDPDAVCWEVRAGTFRKPKGHSGPQVGGAWLWAADWRPCWVHLSWYLALWRRRAHHRRWSCHGAQELGRCIRRNRWCFIVTCIVISLFV